MIRKEGRNATPFLFLFKPDVSTAEEEGHERKAVATMGSLFGGAFL